MLSADMMPMFATEPSFLGTSNRDPAAAVVIAGIPFDLAVSNRSGQRDAPYEIRRMSRILVDGDNPYPLSTATMASWRDPKLQLDFADIGNFRFTPGQIAASLPQIEEQAGRCNHLVALGGDHSISLPLLRALRKKHQAPLGLVHFDAHIDTWPGSFGNEYSHGAVFRHALNEGLIDGSRMIQIGIRSPMQREVYEWTLAQGVEIITADEVHETNPAAIAARIRQKIGTQPCYLSIDVDCLDPSAAPGTGTPEIGGLHSWQLMAILRRLNGLGFAGMDVVEVLPSADVGGITALAAATVVWQYLTHLCPPNLA